MRGAPDEHAPGLYVHVPFCRRICPYCDFAVTPLGRSGDTRIAGYRDALLREVSIRWAPLGADTVYFGGGTPSLLPPEYVAGIAEALVQSELAAPAPFVVLEANPEDLTEAPGLAAAWARAGVSGVSLGVQALDDDRLRFLGRLHRADAPARAASSLAEVGIQWISVDLIYGTPDHPPEALREELEAAAALPGVTHLSAYELSIEPDTPFGRRQAAGERIAAGGAEAFRLVHQTLADCGFEAYEASNFARSEADQSRHNPKYWTGAAYLGLGPSAHSFDPAGSTRSWNHCAVGRWREAVLRGEPPTAGREVLSPRERALESVFLGLRTARGLDLAGFAARYGESFVTRNRARFDQWSERGLATVDPSAGAPRGPAVLPDPGPGSRVVLTLDGLTIADALAREVDLDSIPDHPVRDAA